MPLARLPVLLRLVFRLICPDFCWFIAFGWNSHIQAIALREEVGGPNSDSRRYIRKQLVMIWIILLKHADEAFAANLINAFARGIKEDIIALACLRATSAPVSVLSTTSIGVFRVMVNNR